MENKGKLKGRSMGEWAKRLAILLLGLTIAHLGVTLFLLPGMGADAFTVFVQGLSVMAGLSIGTCHVIVLCVLTAVMALTTRGYILPGSFICAFCGGPIIDIFSLLLAGLVSPESGLVFRLAATLLGCVILAMGMSTVIESDAGTGPNDLVAVILTDKLKRFQFRWVRIACDVFFLAVGWLLGGIVGVGTVIAAFLTGPLVQFFRPKAAAIINKLV